MARLKALALLQILASLRMGIDERGGGGVMPDIEGLWRRPDVVGIEFMEIRTNRLMKYVTAGPFYGWLVFKHPNGQWVSLRKATQDDLDDIGKAFLGIISLEAPR